MKYKFFIFCCLAYIAGAQGSNEGIFTVARRVQEQESSLNSPFSELKKQLLRDSAVIVTALATLGLALYYVDKQKEEEAEENKEENLSQEACPA